MPEPLLIAEKLTKSYAPSASAFGLRKPSQPALIDASLQVNRAEIVGVVGESGSGKTTLARCIALLDRPDSGNVFFKGEDLTQLSRAALRTRRRYIQTIFQDPYASLNPRMRIGDVLEEVIRYHRLATGSGIAARVNTLLDQVGLPMSAASLYPTSFSGGQRQRICIARALAAEPEMLIADEPVSALDVSIQAQIVNLLLDLKEALGLSVIFIGHDLQLVNFIAPRVIIMLKGRIVETIPENKSLLDAEHEYTRELLESVPRLENLRDSGEGAQP